MRRTWGCKRSQVGERAAINIGEKSEEINTLLQVDFGIDRDDRIDVSRERIDCWVRLLGNLTTTPKEEKNSRSAVLLTFYIAAVYNDDAKGKTGIRTTPKGREELSERRLA